MKLTTGKKTTKTAQNTNSSKFNKAWEKVTNQQKKNERLREKIKAFAEQVSEELEQQEKAHITALYKNCEHLLVFYGRKSLAAGNRDALLGWILEHIDTITQNPFAGDIDLAALFQKIEATMEKMHPEEFDAIQDDPTYSEDHFFDDMADDVEPRTLEDFFADLQGEAGFDEFFSQQDAFEQQIKDDELALNKLMKGGSINKLFRRIARVLHPDREQNEEARQEKNRLMSELTEARNNNDITTLFAFYAKYIGDSPLAELGGDLTNATELLNRQYEQLRAEYADILHEDPKAGILYESFHKRTKKATQQAINTHLKRLQQDIINQTRFRQEITSLSKLRPYLQVRRGYFN